MTETFGDWFARSQPRKPDRSPIIYLLLAVACLALLAFGAYYR